MTNAAQTETNATLSDLKTFAADMQAWVDASHADATDKAKEATETAATVWVAADHKFKMTIAAGRAARTVWDNHGMTAKTKDAYQAYLTAFVLAAIWAYESGRTVRGWVDGAPEDSPIYRAAYRVSGLGQHLVYGIKHPDYARYCFGSDLHTVVKATLAYLAQFRAYATAQVMATPAAVLTEVTSIPELY